MVTQRSAKFPTSCRHPERAAVFVEECPVLRNVSGRRAEICVIRLHQRDSRVYPRRCILFGGGFAFSGNASSVRRCVQVRLLQPFLLTRCDHQIRSILSRPVSRHLSRLYPATGHSRGGRRSQADRELCPGNGAFGTCTAPSEQKSYGVFCHNCRKGVRDRLSSA